jgi:adenylate cyclase
MGDDPPREATSPDVSSVVAWLADGARPARGPEHVLDELCARLLTAGLPLDRVVAIVGTPHPDVVGRMFMWRRDRGVEVSETSYAYVETESARLSPVARVMETRQSVRRRVADPAGPNDFPILDDLRAEGVTDYLAVPFEFSNGEVYVGTWATKRPGGFTDGDIAALEAVRKPLSRVAEIYALRRTVVTLLNTYVGPGSGERILGGKIRRGGIERIPAAMLLSDMQGFTALADTLPGEQLIEILNGYFDCQVPAIQAYDGEILKYMGDGLLAIFQPRDGTRDLVGACADALGAAREARARLAARNVAERESDRPVLGIRLALHVGEVLYGNIGAAGRLDFTVVGPGVNLVARLETLASELGREVVASAAFAAAYPSGLERLGRFAIRGFREEQEVYGLSFEGEATSLTPAVGAR